MYIIPNQSEFVNCFSEKSATFFNSFIEALKKMEGILYGLRIMFYPDGLSAS